MKGAELKIYSGGSHSLGDTSKDQLNADLLAFLKKESLIANWTRASHAYAHWRDPMTTMQQLNGGRGSRPLTLTALAIAAVLAFSLVSPADIARAQAAPGGTGARSSILSTGGGQALLDPSDTVLLLLDHQAGLFQTVTGPLAELPGWLQATG